MRELLARLLAGVASLAALAATVAWVILGLIGTPEAAGDTVVAVIGTPQAAGRLAGLLSDYTESPVVDQASVQLEAAAQATVADPAVTLAARTVAAQLWTAQFSTRETVTVDLTGILAPLHAQLGESVTGLVSERQTAEFTPVDAFDGPGLLDRLSMVRTVGALVAVAAFAASIAMSRQTWPRRLFRAGLTVGLPGLGMLLAGRVMGNLGAGIGALIARRLAGPGTALLAVGIALAVGGLVLGAVTRGQRVVRAGRRPSAKRQTSWGRGVQAEPVVRPEPMRPEPMRPEAQAWAYDATAGRTPPTPPRYGDPASGPVVAGTALERWPAPTGPRRHL